MSATSCGSCSCPHVPRRRWWPSKLASPATPARHPEAQRASTRPDCVGDQRGEPAAPRRWRCIWPAVGGLSGVRGGGGPRPAGGRVRMVVPSTVAAARAPSRQDVFFDRRMYVVDVQGWPADQVYPPEPLKKPVVAPERARLRLWETHPHDTRHLPPPAAMGVLLD